jgi:hypothetical protein
MFIEQAILLAYAITIVSETIIILAIQRPKNVLQWIIGIVLINSLTHPIAIYFLHIQNTPYVPVEIGVLIVETLWYLIAFKITWKRAFYLSLFANIFSIISGIAIRFLFH